MKSIFEVDQLICYNGSIPYLFTTCDPSKKLYCSLISPDYGCTAVEDDACTKYHFCNTPQAFWITFGVLAIFFLTMLMTGCLWCCFCCFCGRCCRSCCPCFAKMHDPGKVMPMRNDSGDIVATRMYSGLQENSSSNTNNGTTTYPTAPPAYYDNDD